MTTLGRDLNIIIPVHRDDGTVVHVHAMPISVDVFERYFAVIGAVFARIHAEGAGIISGPRLASLYLKDEAVKRGLWEGPEGVERGLMAEIRRLANVAVPGPDGGWQEVPFQEAVDRKYLDRREVSEVENSIVFFITYSSMLTRPDRLASLDGGARIWGARVDSSSFMDLVASLRTSTPVEPTGEKNEPAASSRPY